MSEKLKGNVSYGRTVNVGNYNSMRIEFSKEFYLDESTYEAEFVALKKRVDASLQTAGLVSR